MLNRFVYTVLFYLLLPLVLLRLLYRAWRAPEYARRWRERFGWFDAALLRGTKTIWLHSVSVGESIAAEPLVKALQAKYPDHRLVVTTMTPTGSDRVRALYGDSVFHVYAPYDLPDAIARFLNRVQPRLAIIMETELWPNTIAACSARNIPVMVANARLSARSARGYSKFPALIAPMLGQLDMIAAQNSDTANRFRDLGVAADRVMVSGSLKFDLLLDSRIKAVGAALREQWLMNKPAGTRILVVASTHQGEDEQVLDACDEIMGSVLMVLVPRHPERFRKVADLLDERKISYVRRSVESPVGAETKVVLGDTMGELLAFFATADLAFIGGSLVPTGGHNMLEACALGVPVLSGPHVFNFKEISEQLCEAGAMLITENRRELAESLNNLLADDPRRLAMGAAGRAVVEQNRGALHKQLELCQRLIK